MIGQKELVDSTVQETLSALTENSLHQQTEMQELLRLQKLRDESQQQLENELRCALQRQRQLEDELRHINQGHVRCDEASDYHVLSQQNASTPEMSRNHAGTQTSALEASLHRHACLESSTLATEEVVRIRGKEPHVLSDLIGSAISCAIEECRRLEHQMSDLQSAVHSLDLLLAEQTKEGAKQKRTRPVATCRSANALPPIEVRTWQLAADVQYKVVCLKVQELRVKQVFCAGVWTGRGS
jgi:hypothetical protein